MFIDTRVLRRDSTDSVGRDVGRYLSQYSTDISADTRPLSRPIVDRHLRQHSANTRPKVSVDISADTRPTSPLTLGQHSTESVGRYLDRYSTNTRRTLDRHYKPILDRPLPRHSIMSVDSRPTLSADTRPISRLILDRHFGRHLADTRPIVSPIETG